MAKKRQTTTRFSIQGFDLNHYRTTEQYAAAVQALFDRATLAIARSAASRNIDPDKPFSFDDYPEVKTELQKVVGQLASQLQTTIETGSKKQWLFACDKNDGFLDSIMDTSKLSKARLSKMQDRNLDALSTFQGRKVGGMDLSQRVWRYVGQFKEQLESALDVGLGEGRSAQELARDVKKNLREPDRLFRRVRDKRGNLVLSKAARAYHPGQGVYRSSVKNAQRLTRSEINMAYRESDFLRWQQLDFVVGFEIHRSNHEPLCKCKMCDRLQGRYPKTFKFKGWHPQCMCYAVPILMDEETFDENELGDLKAALRGTEYKKKQSRNLVTDVPDGFKEWVEENKEASAGWSSTPYFIQDNFVDGDLSKGLKIALPTLEPDVPDTPTIQLFKATTPQELKDYILANIADDCALEIKKSDLDLWNDIVNQLNQRIQQFGMPKFSRIGKPASPQAEASWDEHNNGFNINITAMRTKSAIKREEKWRKKGILWSHTNEDKEDYVRATIDHEIGHRLLSLYGFMNDATMTVSKAGKAVFVNGKPFNEINDVLGYYASTDVHEYFAEAFSMFAGARRDKLGEHTKAMMERFIEKVKKKTGQDPFAAPAKPEPKIALPTLEPDVPGASFMPIKTVKEASALATSLGIKKVDFGDATIDEINIALEVLHGAAQQMDFELDYFFLAKDLHKLPGSSFSKPVGGWFSADKNTMAIDLTTFRESQYKPIITYQDKIVSLRGNIANLERQIEQSESRLGRSKSMDKMLKADIKMFRSRISDIEIKIKSFEKLIASGSEALPLTVAATFKDIRQQVQAEIWHEIGHYVDNKTGRLKFNEGNIISEYSKDARGEEFAEWFSYYKMNGEKDVPADLLKIFKSVERGTPRKTEPKIDPVQAQLDALMPSIESARKVAEEWGLDIQLKTLNTAIANREINKINERIATITQKANELITMLSKFVKDVADVTKSAKANGVDINKLPEFTVVTSNLMAAQANKKDWKSNFGAYQRNLDSLKAAIQNELLRRKQEEEKKKQAAATEVSMDDWRERTKNAGSIPKSENDKEFEKTVGVEKGVDMTFDEANALRGNPNFAEEFLECTQAEATHKTTRDGKTVWLKKNPAYKKKYTINCQSCVVAHEMRRRGFDVEAIGNTANSIPRILSHHTELAWLDKDGNTPTSTKVSWLWAADKAAMGASLVANLETATKEVGRYHMKWTWGNGRSGNIITCERLANGTLRIYDPQNGKVITDFAEYGSRFMHGTLKILRVDNLRINPLYAGCLKKTPKPKKKK